LVAKAKQVLLEVQGIRADPVFTDVTASVPGIPQYPPGYASEVDRLNQKHPRRRFVGWGYTGIGVSKCVRAGHQYGQS
jgi:oxygen-dependent protoporphyrinogen oxidase